MKRGQFGVMVVLLTLLAAMVFGCTKPGSSPVLTPPPEPDQPDWEISETLLAEIEFSFVPEFTAASPDGRRFGYATEVGLKMIMVVDGEKGQEYDAVWSPPVFSPDSQRVAFMATAGRLRFVVVDGVEGPAYETHLTKANIVFDSPNSLRHLGAISNLVYLVQIKLE